MLLKNFGISLSTVHNIIKRFRESEEMCKCTMDKAENQYWKSVILGPQMTLYWNQTIRMEGSLPKPSSVNTVRCYVHEHNRKLYHVKRKQYMYQIQKRQYLHWTGAHLRWTECGKLSFHQSKYEIPLRNYRHSIFQAKDERYRPVCYQHSLKARVCIFLHHYIRKAPPEDLRLCTGS